MRARISIALTLLVCLCACGHLRVNRAETAAPNAPLKELSLHSFAWGFVPVSLPSEPEICPGSRMESAILGFSTGDVLITLVTFGVYVPQRVTIACFGGN